MHSDEAPAAGSEGSAKGPDEVRRSADAFLAAESQSFRLHESMERSALNVIGAYQNILDRVTWLRFHLAGPTSKPDVEKSLVKAARLAAESANIAWPHDEFSRIYDRSNKVRQRLAHMSWIESIEGDRPNRVMTVIIAAEPGWVDAKWSQQPFQRKEIHESEIRETLGDLLQLRRYIHALGRIISIFEEVPDMPDEHELTREYLPLPWWLPDWGPPRDKIRVDQLRTDRTTAV